jgi:hypothetical protein
MCLKWKVVALALPAAFLVACKEQPSAPEAALQQTHAIAADYTNNPDGGSQYLARYTFDQFFGYFDRADGLVRAWFTTFPLDGYIDLGNGNVPWDNATCGPQTGTGVVHFQQISHWDPNDPTSVFINNAKGTVWIVLTSRAQGATGPCAARPLIASGWGTVKYNDNNGSGIGKPQDAWSWGLLGDLTLVGGGTIHFRGHTTCVFHNGDWTSTVCHTEFHY